MQKCHLVSLKPYYKHLQTMQNFDVLVDLSGKTLKE